VRLRGVGDRVHTNARLQRCRPSASRRPPWRATGRRAARGPFSGSWGVLAACPGVGLCFGFAGGAFLAPNDRRRGEAVGSPVCPARKPAFPGCETAPPWRTQARRACYRWSSTRPWCFTPSPASKI
jgi:hypothetical protein